MSDTAAADPDSLPPMVPCLGAVAGTVKTSGSMDGGGAVLEGKQVPLGNMM